MTGQSTVKPVKNSHSQKTNYCLMKVKSIAECSPMRILQYNQPALSYHLSLRSLFCLFLRVFTVLDGVLTFVFFYRN